MTDSRTKSSPAWAELQEQTRRATARFYTGLWRGLVEWLRVPAGPPVLPGGEASESVRGVRPAEGFLRYLKFHFWLVLALVDVVLIVVFAAIALAQPVAGAILALPVLALLVVPDAVAWVLIHLKYDSTWYVLTDRAARLRRGILIIEETTITYENVQDVTVRSGPLQRYFGIADVVIQTAGGTSVTTQHGTHVSPNQGVIEGVADAPALRDLIMQRVRASRSAGLGDELAAPVESPRADGGRIGPECPALAREIASTVRAIRAELRPR